MNLPFEVDGAYLALGVVALCLLLYLGRRIKQRRLARIHRDRNAEIQPGDDVLDDGFYCIMLKDGTTRAGFIERGGIDGSKAPTIKTMRTYPAGGDPVDDMIEFVLKDGGKAPSGFRMPPGESGIGHNSGKL